MSDTDKKRKGKAKMNSAQAYKLGNREAVNKAKRKKRTEHKRELKENHDIRRMIAGKPYRGFARDQRREREREAAKKQAAAITAAIEAPMT